MNHDLLNDVRRRLDEFEFKQQGDWLRKGRCPSCAKRELYTHADSPWVLRCGRLNNCNYEIHVKELYSDLFEHWSTRYPATPENPRAAADAYLSSNRGFDLARIAGCYAQEAFHDSKTKQGSATVRFNVGDTWWERLIDQPGRFGKDKARFKFGGRYAGEWFVPPNVDLTSADKVWLVEGIFDAIALMHHGIAAVALMACNNYPAKALAELKQIRSAGHPVLVWALDGDPAGRSHIKKWFARAEKDGWLCQAAVIPQTRNKKYDWNDLHLLDRSQTDEKLQHLSEEGLKNYLHHGALLTARTATEKALLMYTFDNRRTEFDFEFGRRLYWFSMDVSKYQKAMDRISDEESGLSPEKLRELALAESGGIRPIANCNPYPLYYQANTITDESWYYFRVEFPHDGQAIKNTFTSSQLSASTEFKKRLLSIAPGAMYTGSNMMLERTLERQLYNIKRVDTLDYIGYSSAHQCYVFDGLAVHGGKIHKLNDEDFFDIGRLSIKSLMAASLKLEINDNASDYDKSWIQTVWQAFGAQGFVAVAAWAGSLFAEQIRAAQKSFPFIEIIGEPGSGKSTLIEFMWRLFGRIHEGTDPASATAAGRGRTFLQVSNLPVVLIESDRGEPGDTKRHGRTFDWQEIKTLYNGRGIRSRGRATGGNETYEPPFRGSLVISQNYPVMADRAVLERIVHFNIDKSGHTSKTWEAAKKLEQIPMEHLSGFILAATTREAQIVETIKAKVPEYTKQLIQHPEITHARIAQNHAQILALVDALQAVLPMNEQQYELVQAEIISMAIERVQAIDADHPVVNEFWDMYHYLNGDEDRPRLDHSRNDTEIAINLNHFIQVAMDHKQQVPPLSELKIRLKESKRHRYVTQKVVNSAIPSADLGNRSSGSQRCWIFSKETR